MNLPDALGPSIATRFESQSHLLPRDFFYGPDAADSLAQSLAAMIPGRRAIVIADARTSAVAEKPCLEALVRAGWDCSTYRLEDGPGGASPVCDDATHARLGETLPQADMLVAVGSGVVNDLTKWVAADRNIPYAVLATAASMNGYASANVAPAIGGVKTLVHAHAPRVIAAIPRVIESAPWNLTASGLGDVIAKPVSTADWLINHRIFGEPFSPEIASIIDTLEPSYLEQPERLARRDASAVRALFDALVRSGCAMTLQGSSMPASGGEHLVSHTLDMLAHLDGVPHDLHGRQVGVATILAAALYERIVAIDEPHFEPRVAPFAPAFWGPIAPAVEAEFRKKKANVETAARWLSQDGNWHALRSELRPMLRSSKAIRDCLAKSNAAWRISDIGCTRDRFLLAVKHCGAIRGRFTSIDLAWSVGLLPDAAEQIVDEMLT